jgi:hypothetical protein
MCGAAGSALAAAIYVLGNWVTLAAVGALFCAAALLTFTFAPAATAPNIKD